ncbi:MAG: aminomethyl transferase family protein [Candidatus Rokubacteria bacterium]|nr:aminomethyl transferase family protein [Candidatus Rokubacteria bacterium]MBI3827350.1 aminomethyl transferase family protein [Candidatus Rokubacteria bacterium]
MANADPLHDLHAAAGARFGSPCGVELPLDYGDAAAEYEAVRRGVGLLDHGDCGVLEVTGRDRATFLHAMLSQDVKSLAPGQGAAAAFLDIHGKVQVTLRLLVQDDRILVITPPGLATKTSEALDHYLFSEKAVFRDATGESCMLTLAGPEAAAVAQRLTGTVVAEPEWSHVPARLGDVEVRLVRGDGETGEPEVWLIGAAADGPAVWRAALAAGARPVGLHAKDALRIEAGTPYDGHDVDETVLLPEIPQERLVSHTKGCYIGQEVVVRIRDRGHVNRHLRGLLVEGGRVPVAGAAVLAGDDEVGRVTSAAWSYGRRQPVALAFVKRQHAEPGTPLAVRLDGSVARATVSALPFTR